MHVNEVFTPGDFPEYTYVERSQGSMDELTNEEELTLQVNKQSYVATISGPSKSGKTVLVEKVVQDNKEIVDKFVKVNGKQIRSGDKLWSEVANALSAPIETTSTETEKDEEGIDGSISASIGLVDGSVGGSTRDSSSDRTTQTLSHSGLNRVLRMVDDRQVLIYIDDSHYIPQSEHRSIAENIKMAFEHGLNFCLAYIPYRSNDLTKANNDLIARSQHLTLNQWKKKDLEKIADMGFSELNIRPPEYVKKHFAREAIKSPYIMQSLCYRFCMENKVKRKNSELTDIDIGEDELKRILRREANKLDYSTAYDIISGAASGRSQKSFTFVDDSDGDRYIALLRGITANPPKSSFELDELKKRIRQQCKGESPQSGNITQDIVRVHEWINDSDEENFIFDYLEDRKRVEMVDSNLIFYLRWSDKLELEPNLENL